MSTIKADSSNVFDDRGYSGPLVRNGTVNPVTLIEKAMRERIIESMYWKEQLFGVSESTLCDKAVALQFIGGSVNNRPSPFICCLLKLLSLTPSNEIILEMLNYEEDEDLESGDEHAQGKEERNGDSKDIEDINEKERLGKRGAHKYLRALAAFYVRLCFSDVEIYKTLEPLLLDFRRLKRRRQDGFSIMQMDVWVDELLTARRVCGTALPELAKRSVLEDLDLLDPRESPLADEVDAMDDEDVRSRGSRYSSRSQSRSWSRDRDSRSRSRSRDRSYTRSRSKSRSPRRVRDSRSRSASQDYRRRSRSVDSRDGR